jgi:vesicle-fusing ATPase
LAELLSKKIPPKIVSGPEIFDKYVGGSSEKIRNLFKDAESDKKGDLHVIIFDEFDSIGAKRSSGDGTGDKVGNEVVNQLLSKIEGQQKLNNILLIAMTNRKDAIDEALLRPGRFEVHIEIKLPRLDERKEIIEIHCLKMIQNGAIEDSVDLDDLAKRTHNFTGAEINGLIKSAASYALSRTIDINDEGMIHVNSIKPLVTMDDFDKAFTDIKPQFGIQQHRMFQKSETESQSDEQKSIFPLDNSKSDASSDANKNSEMANPLEQIVTLKNIYQNHEIPSFISSYQTICMHMNIKEMIDHEKKVGKFALDSKIDCLMCIDYFDMIGMNESQKCIYIKNVYVEASKTLGSLVVINDVNTIIGYNNYNNYFSVAILQTITTLLRYYMNVKSIVTCTGDMKMDDLFDLIIKV